MHHSRLSALCAGVSIVALTLGVSEVRAADMPIKAPAPEPPGDLTVWVEGGAFWTARDPVFFAIPGGADSALFTPVSVPSSSGNVFPGLGTGTGFDPRAGGEGAVGIDYRFAGTPWHVSFEARYGSSIAAGQDYVLSSNASPPPTLWSGQSNMGEKETHAVADFMFGRDIGPAAQIKFGLRVAYLGAELTDSISASASTGPGCSSGGTACSRVVSAVLSADERSTFIGAGPRFAIEGAVPFSPSWAFVYGGGAALLIGEQQMSIESGSQSNCGSSGSLSSLCFNSSFCQVGFVGLGAVPNGTFAGSNVTAVVNANATAALAYSFSRYVTLSAGVRFDGYWNALKTIDSGGTVTNTDRLYYEPFLRLSARF